MGVAPPVTGDVPDASPVSRLTNAFTSGPFTAGVGQAMMRRLLSGLTVPQGIREDRRGHGWAVGRGPEADGGLSSHPDHPSRKHDIDVHRTVERARIFHSPHGGLSRRERRARDRAW